MTGSVNVLAIWGYAHFTGSRTTELADKFRFTLRRYSGSSGKVNRYFGRIGQGQRPVEFHLTIATQIRCYLSRSYRRTQIDYLSLNRCWRQRCVRTGIMRNHLIRVCTSLGQAIGKVQVSSSAYVLSVAHHTETGRTFLLITFVGSEMNCYIEIRFGKTYIRSRIPVLSVLRHQIALAFNRFSLTNTQWKHTGFMSYEECHNIMATTLYWKRFLKLNGIELAIIQGFSGNTLRKHRLSVFINLKRERLTTLFDKHIYTVESHTAVSFEVVGIKGHTCIKITSIRQTDGIGIHAIIPAQSGIGMQLRIGLFPLQFHQIVCLYFCL